MLEIGQILKPQGIRGEIKVKPLTSDPSRFCVLKSLTVRGKAYRVESVRISGADVYIKLGGVDDRNAAEALRGAFIEIERCLAVETDKDEFFIADLVGSKLYTRRDGGEVCIGEIAAIDSYGAADVFTVACAEGEMTFPFVKALNAEFDGDKKILYVDGQRLNEVAVYED